MLRKPRGMDIKRPSPGSATTKLDGAIQGIWGADEIPTTLRQAGSEQPYELSDLPAEIALGASPDCHLRLYDPEGRVSREHARLRRYKAGWQVLDLESTNGVVCDGARIPPLSWYRIRPGNILGLGGLELFVESARTVELRRMLARLLGWAAERQSIVDQALRDLISCLVNRTPLVVVGDGKLHQVVRRLLRCALVPGTPFVVHDPRHDVADAILAVGQGTLCVAMRRPSDADSVLASLRDLPRSMGPRLVLCAQRASLATAAGKALESTQVLALPALASRSDDDLHRIIHEWAVDVVDELAAPPTVFPMPDLRAINRRRWWIETFDDLEEAVQRVVAWRIWGVTQGAARLGISHPSLGKWLRKRKLIARDSGDPS